MSGGSIPSLQCMAAQAILQQCLLLPKRIENYCEIYHLVSFMHFLRLSDVDYKLSGLESFYMEYRRKVKDCFPTLLDRVGPATLEQYLGSDFMSELMSMNIQQNIAKFRMTIMRSGQVIEPTKVSHNNITSVGDDSRYYPLEVLVQGVQWPRNVDPIRREDFLLPEEFIEVFGVTKEHFKTMPKFIQTRMKKDKRLF